MLSLFINNALYSTDHPTCHVYSAAAYDSSKLRTELIDADIFFVLRYPQVRLLPRLPFSALLFTSPCRALVAADSNPFGG